MWKTIKTLLGVAPFFIVLIAVIGYMIEKDGGRW